MRIFAFWLKVLIRMTKMSKCTFDGINLEVCFPHNFFLFLMLNSANIITKSLLKSNPTLWTTPYVARINVHTGPHHIFKDWVIPGHSYEVVNGNASRNIKLTFIILCSKSRKIFFIINLTKNTFRLYGKRTSI